MSDLPKLSSWSILKVKTLKQFTYILFEKHRKIYKLLFNFFLSIENFKNKKFDKQKFLNLFLHTRYFKNNYFIY